VSPDRLGQLSRYTFLSWALVVGITVLFVLPDLFTRNETRALVGLRDLLVLDLAFVLFVSVVTLPLLVVAAVLDQKAKRARRQDE
jgi:hypothetical protein